MPRSVGDTWEAELLSQLRYRPATGLMPLKKNREHEQGQVAKLLLAPNQAELFSSLDYTFAIVVIHNINECLCVCKVMACVQGVVE